jgi:hypothetical protein
MKWRDIHKIWAAYEGKHRKETVANFRLKTGQDCPAAHVRKIGICVSSERTVCQMPNSTMDKEQLLHCPELDSDQQVLKEHHQTLLGCLSNDVTSSKSTLVGLWNAK